MGHGSFVSGKVRLPTNELVEIFLFLRCRNMNCKNILPVDDCDFGLVVMFALIGVMLPVAYKGISLDLVLA
ncbi:hypothetical protein OIU76_011472 [Salix suchowensis]|nr:hypothetical protein OIU76_011472 [Salix suchowensis]